MTQRILFVIRGKLGDTLLSYATVRAWYQRHPDHDITVLMRANYVNLFKTESGVRFIPFSSKIGMVLRLMKLRLFTPAFDALMVLWAFGLPVKLIGWCTHAKRKVYLNDRFARLFPEWPREQFHTDSATPAWQVARCVDPELLKPDSVALASLQNTRLKHLAQCSLEQRAVGVVPIADEARRCVDVDTVKCWLADLKIRHPHQPLCLFLNPTDRAAQALLAMQWPEPVKIRLFPSLSKLVQDFLQLDYLYCTDTGLYHLAVAMGIPCRIYFGPTQPNKVILLGQPGVESRRLSLLENRHCEVKDCAVPYCLYQTVRNDVQAEPVFSTNLLPGCLLAAGQSDQWHRNQINPHQST